MTAEEVLKLAAPEIVTSVQRHLRDRHGDSGQGDQNVRLAHHQAHGVAPIKEWKSVWSCWTPVPHPHP